LIWKEMESTVTAGPKAMERSATSRSGAIESHLIAWWVRWRRRLGGG
jgi:hypothetical protein